MYREWAPIVPMVAIAGGITAALVIGAVAGLYPAARLARVSPTDALRGA
jgi:putative ABC transport system permease protein